MRRTLQIAIGLALLITPGLALAQEAIITGTVTDDQGEVLLGANVALEELIVGAATDNDGRYTIRVPGDRVNGQRVTLVVRFIGFETTRRSIILSPGNQVHDIELNADLLNLDEVVVTALGIEREERSLGYAVQEVNVDALEKANETNLVNALAGKVAGVYVNSSSGQPGKSSHITIRGSASLLGNNQPLFVIDGVPISNDEDENEGNPGNSIVFIGGTANRAVDIDPNIIEDINILKGASATALYGSRAANGAIIITTKGGRSGQAVPRITYTSRVRSDDAIIEGFQNEYLQGQNGFFQNGLPLSRGGYVQPGAESIGGNPLTNPQTTLSWGPHKDEVDPQVLQDLSVDRVPVFNPRADFYQTGLVFENSLSLSGGTAGTSYFLSVGDLRQEGIVPGTKLDRTSLLAKFGTRLSDKLNVLTSVNYVNTENDWLSEGNGARTYLFGLNFAPISFDITEFEYEDGSQRNHTQSFNNPLWLTENTRYASDVDRFIASTSATYDLLPGLRLSERIGIDTYSDQRKEEINIGTVSRPNGSMYDQKITRREINSDFTIQLDRALAEGFNLTALAGNNINSRYYQYDFIDGDNLGVPGFFNVSNASSVTGTEYEEKRLLVSAFGQLTLDYRDFAYLTLTARNDWSSTLPTDNNSYFYPSASLGLVFTQAFSFFDRTPLNYGKLRGSIAQIGSDAPVYALSTTFVQSNPGDGQRGNINFPFNGINGYRTTRVLGNPDLKPEISTEYEIGLDLRFFSQRMTFDAAYYNRTTKDQIFQVPLSAATGYVTRLQNAGEIRNQGFELTVGLSPIRTRDLDLNFLVNFTRNRSEVVALAEGVENLFLAGFTNPQIRIQPGKDGYGVIWGTRYSRNEEGHILIDDDGLPILDNELGAIGNVQPDWLANARASLRFKGLTLSALLDIREGGDILNFDGFYSIFYGTHIETANRNTSFVWEGVNATTGEPNTTEIMRDEFYYRAIYTNAFENLVEDGSFIKLREVSLAYTLPTKWVRRVGLQNATITGTGRNLWIDTDFTYGDPEGNLFGSGNGQGFYHMVAPSTRSYAVSVRLTL